ncbi:MULTISPECIES: alpha-2-macroglobulin [Dyella]|uniref:Alpha-2-macroglobulin family protein n=2 Tax=Dyella TaxID=231454 RepID=A0A4R0YUV8_9GAMM|nr:MULTISPECIES: alpha-2-macroglobulin [Dyella]TBR39310.1 alpha-2-macroglobulin family protein [Dyella terrae]TCI13102.1 alpha-2-macroglobulin family protein [Dyella soli]
MDLLRFLLMLPVRLVRGALWLLGLLLRPLFGGLSWTAPAWMPASATFVRQRPLRAAGMLAGALVLAASGWFGWNWYQHRPRPPEPERITASVQVPEITDYTHSPVVIHSLRVDFSGSAAPIERVGKPVTEGIVMEPALKGAWTWTDDHTLQFVPADDWPVGRHVNVRFDVRRVFASHVLMADDSFSFDLAPFKASFGTGEFYQDPQDATARKTIQPVDFNYPVDPAQFEKRIGIKLKSRGKGEEPLKFTVTYDQFKLHAWIHSQPLALPSESGAVLYSLDKGISSSRGGDATTDRLDTSIAVPGLYSLAINQISPTLVDNERYEPEQVLLVESSGTVRGTALAGLVKAWVLPRYRTDIKHKDGDPDYRWSAGTVSEATLRQATPLNLELVPTENDFEALQSFRFHAEPGQQVYVRVDKGLTSFGGYILGEAVGQVVKVPDYPKLLRFMADGSLLSLNGSKRLSVVSRNLPGMRVDVGRVLPDQLQHLVAFNEGSYARPSMHYAFSEDHIVERMEIKRSFPPGDPGKARYEGVDLGQYLKDGKRGIFMLRVTSYDADAERKKEEAAQARASEPQAAPRADGDYASDDDRGDSQDYASSRGPNDTRLVVVTDLGMLVKRAVDGAQDVFVQSIRNGQPVSGAEVSVLAVNGQPLYREITGADGVVHFPSLKGLDREKRPTLYVVRKGDDLSFLPIGSYDRQLDFSRFDIGGERNATNQGQLSGYLFSDRGIYRPGDLFHVGMIVRAASWTRSVAGVPLQAEIVDPRGVTVKQVPVSMDGSGFAELAYAPAETAPTGTWTVNLYIVREGKSGAQIGSTTLQVKEFLPDRMKVSAKLSQQVPEGWVKPDGLKGIIDAQNLFGTPAADRRVEASLTLRPAWPAFRSWPDYHFYDARRAKEGFEETLQDGKTDAKGHAEFDLDLKKYANATYQLYFLAKAHEPDGGRSVAAAAQTLVSSNDWLVGYRAQDNLSYVTRNAPRAVHLVAIDPQAKAMALQGLRARLIERRYISVLTKQDSGVYKYQSKLKEIPVKEDALALPATGLNYTLPTDKPGNYALVIVRGSDGVEVNRVDYSVAGAANVSRSLDRNAELQLNLDKQDYAPGETIAIAIRAPYAGNGLITIERDKVYAHVWFHADTTSSVQHITVPSDFEGNGYINVQYVRDPSSDEIFMSPLSYGVVPFSVNLDARRNEVKVESPALVKPGQAVTFKLTSAQPARAVVFAVDEGILQVARYKLGDPLKFFFRKRMLEVNTSQILDLILPEFEKLMSMAAPGGDADAAISRQLNPFKRKRDIPVAFWSGIVDVNGEKELSYTVPDYFNGKLRVMAVTVSADRVGTFEGATTVRGDFVLSPNVPTTLAPGDEADISVGVANNLTGLGGKEVPVAVSLKVGPQLQVVGKPTQSINLGEMREGVAVFRVRATDQLGSGNLSFTAGYGDKSARQSVDLSVRPATAYRTQLHYGLVAPGSKVDVPDLRKMHDAYASRAASFSTLPVVLAQGLSSYLINYPNYCSEQIISSAMPLLILPKWPVVPVFAHTLDPATRDKKISNDEALARFLDVLHTRQNSEGGFGFWVATPDADPFVSTYAMNFLIEARDRGISVPADMFDAGNAYLRKLAGDDDLDGLPMLRQRAYAIYLLTRQGQVTTNALAAVQRRLEQDDADTWKHDLAAVWMAASYQLLKQEKQANALIAGPLKDLARSKNDERLEYDYFDDALIRDATTLYILGKHFPDRARAVPAKAWERIAWDVGHEWYNTLSSSMLLLALDSYAHDNVGDLSKLRVDAVGADGGVQSIGTVEGNLLLSGSWSSAARRLRYTNGGEVSAWYLSTEGGYDRDVPNKAVAEGLEIVREYTDAKGKALGDITVGQEIDVHVKIRATTSDGLDNVAIVDLLPGGFEAVVQPPPAVTDQQEQGESDEGGDSEVKASAWRSPIGLSSSTWSPEYADIREDRVVIYGRATADVREFVYRIKATNAGKFKVPPAYGESMYNREVQARTTGGAVLNVVSKP